VDPLLVSLLRADLDAAGYTVDRLRELWGEEADAALRRDDRVPARRALSGSDDPAATLAILFLLGLPVPLARLAAALPSLGVDGAERLGLVTVAGEEARAAIDLRPYAFLDARGTGEWWIASDLGELQTGGPLRTDHVLGVGGASATLAGLILPGPIGRALDLGTGCGIQALHLAREAREVVATDLSARALDFARLTAALDGVELDLRLGSLFEPVAGERFDRIVSNPPFVITPRAAGVPEYEYRDGGAVGDELVERVVTGLADHLEPGGIAQLLGNWEYRLRPDGSVEDGLLRAAGWAEAAGLEYWIVERETQDAAGYAETWIRDGGTRPGHPDYERLVAAWLDDFAARGVTAVGFGYLLLRRPIDPGLSRGRASALLRRAERLDAPLGEAAASLGGHLERCLAAHDATAVLSDGEFAALRLRVAPDVTEERSHWPGDEHPTVIALRQGGGFRREIRVGTALAAVVGACDGDLPLGSILAAVATLLEADKGALSAELLPELRDLLVAGLVELAD